MPAHTHTVVGDASPATSNDPTGNRYAQSGSPIYHEPDAANAVAMSSNAFGSVGTNAVHTNMQPYLVVNFCIAITGLFPSRN